MSSAKGRAGQSKQRQKHQNTFAFKADKYSSKQADIIALPVGGVCRKCMEIIQWRKRMGQYKPLTVPKKCVSCSQKTVKEAYHILCKSCANLKQVCAKCQQPEEILPSTAGKSASDLQTDQQNEDRLLSMMTERQRRSYQRKLARGDDEGAAKVASKTLVNDDDDDTSLDDFLSSDDE